MQLLAPQVALSERELEVLRWMAQFKTDREIGKLMFLSVKTVKAHGVNLRRKMNARNRTEAVVLGYQMGLVDF